MAFFICACIAAAFVSSLFRVKIDNDILNVMPRTDSVTRDAREILKHNPVLDRVIIDLHINDSDPDKDLLAEAADIVAERLRQSGLFETVGIGEIAGVMPDLFMAITDNLPLMFDRNDLEKIETSHLTQSRVDDFVRSTRDMLSGLQGIGQAQLIDKDPLQLRYLVLGRLARSVFNQDAQVYKNHVISGDGRHLLLICAPAFPATDTTFSRNLTGILNELADELGTGVKDPGKPVILTHLGSYRYALDNERIVRRDATRALILITGGIAFLLLMSFPRAYIGILALVPAIAGAMLAFFVYSLFQTKISALALGFGGALISITVDHSIAYLLFLDRTQVSSARYASREVWSVGLFAVLTTAGAFCVLLVSGFPLLAQVGFFAALGIVFSFLFLHSVLPMFLPELKAARRPPLIPVENLLKRVTTSRGWLVFGIAVVLTLLGILFAKPSFHVDLSSMNTASSETLATEQTLKTVWGDIASNVYVMLEGENIEALQALSDEVAGLWEEHLRSGFLSSGFTPSMVFPGEHRARKNLAAWKDFWTERREKKLKKDLDEASARYGFSREAFAPFLEQLRAPRYRALEISETLHDFFGISRKPEGNGWRLLSSAIPGENYDARMFFEANKSLGTRVFDPDYFASRLAVILADTFTRMLLIIALGVLVLLTFLFLSWQLILLTLAPLVFSFVCTLATLRLMGRTIDIPSLMLAIVIFGMGVDYGIFLVRSQQRFLNEHHPSQGPIRTAVFLAAASTLLGMGALTFSEHAVLRSAGMTSFLGIGYSALGAFVLLPPVLSRLFSSRFPPRVRREPGSAGHRRDVLRRFKLLEPYPRLFARFKMLTDVMFLRLAQWVQPSGTVLDIGCGFGVPAVWLLTCYPDLRFVGIEPDAARVRVAERVIGPDGYVVHTSAQELPPEPMHVDTVLMLDVADRLSDKDLSRVLKSVYSRLVPGGSLVMRIPMPAEKSWFWKQVWNAPLLRLSRRRRFFRANAQICRILEDAGFSIRTIQPAEKGRNITWYIAFPSPQENP